ncbi:MAG TPA: hypothetical protein PKI19_01075 [Elusimicrobiales bacterium]|nr:hypothetical protein [Elusimicrobiales bacterium]
MTACRRSVAGKLLRGAFFIFLALLPAAAVAQEQNKVIVRDFKWSVYATEHFDIHYAPDAEPWLAYAAGVLEAAYRREAAALNPALSKRIPFFLFASVNDMQQSNVADVSDGVGGLTEPYKDRFMVWSDGSREWLREVIEHEFAHEVEFSILIDGFWKSARILKTFIYPLWMMEGLAEYQTGLADYAVEKMYVRDAALGPGLPRLSHLNQFAHLKPHQTTLAYKTGAQAVRFLAGQYGAEKPRKMLELFRTRYDAGSVLRLLIGADLETFDKKFREYTSLKYQAEVSEQRLQEPGAYASPVTAGSERIPEFNLSPALSPDGGRLAYLSTKAGHPPELRIRDLVTGAERKLTALDAGAENIPYGRFTKPLRSLAWSPDGAWLAFTGQKNHREYLFLYSPGTEQLKRAAVEGLAELRQPAFSPDGAKLAFVGMRGSFNDLYEAPVKRLAQGGTLAAGEVVRLTESPRDEASPAYAPDGSGLAYSCETETSSSAVRKLCFLPAGQAERVLAGPDGNVYDPVFSADGRTVYFISDAGDNFELYGLDRDSGQVRRLTRTLGGVFNPTPSGDKIYFSAFWRGDMHIYGAAAASLLREPVQPAAPAAAKAGEDFSLSSGTFLPYRFKASMDLFFPAFLFSSPGGLFWMNYWQASDMLGNHNLSLYLNYNSGAEYRGFQASYVYARWRMPVMFQAAGAVSKGLVSSGGFEYDKSYGRQSVAAAWPFDRYRRVEAMASVKNEANDFKDPVFRERLRTRSLQTSYVRDTLNGLYLTANRGSRTELSYLKAAATAGGNLKYDVYLFRYLKYFPLSKRASFVNHFTAGRSVGRDRRLFNFGGLGGVRGFASSAPETEKPGAFLNNAELRVPLFKDLDYYMGYMFPDFYFKSVYARLFADSGYGWDKGEELGHFAAGQVRTAAGIGVNVHTFILQAFPLVLSFDYAVRTSDGGKIFYFYLGPLF